MLSSGADKPGSEALLSEFGLGWLVLIWLSLVGHVGTRLGQSQNQIRSSLTEKIAFIYTGSEENSLLSSSGPQYRLNPGEREHTGRQMEQL